MNEVLTQLSQALGKKLQDSDQSVSCVESCTGGGLAYWITNTQGSSAYFAQSFVTYSNEAKQALVNVPMAMINAHGAVSQEVATLMARGLQTRSLANFNMAITGIAGPSGGSAEKPVGLVWFACAYGENVMIWKQNFTGDRSQIREKACEFALNKLIELI